LNQNFNPSVLKLQRQQPIPENIEVMNYDRIEIFNTSQMSDQAGKILKHIEKIKETG